MAKETTNKMLERLRNDTLLIPASSSWREVVPRKKIEESPYDFQ